MNLQKWGALLVLSVFICLSFRQVQEDLFVKPKHFPEPHYNFKENPLTEKGVQLGKALFFDAMLSKDNTISCGSCHQQSSGFTQHGHALSHGVDDLLTQRNSMPVQNMAWFPDFGWDGGVPHLDLFAISPIQKENEMGETLPNVLEKLRATEHYPKMFQEAFGDKSITTEHFLKAISQYMLTLVSANSAYDKYQNGNKAALNETELQGLAVFNQKCATCHSGELFSDFSHRNNGVKGEDGEDTGREAITLSDKDKYKFRVPSLRNVAVTFPYMHDGSIETLEEVLDHYTNLPVKSPYLDPVLKSGISLTDGEKKSVLAFLNALTDQDFLTNPRFAEPGADIVVASEFKGDWEKTDFGKLDIGVQKALLETLGKYISIKNALGEQDGKTSAVAAAEMQAAFKKVRKEALTPLQTSFFTKIGADLAFDIEHIQETNDYKHQLDHFKYVSVGLYKLVKAFKVKTEQPLLYVYCSEADRKKGGYWLNEQEKVLVNPYLGKKNKCSEVKERL